jgi:hypothetical protein
MQRTAPQFEQVMTELSVPDFGACLWRRLRATHTDVQRR